MKRTCAIIGIGLAFLAASLWVWLSNGKSAKAVKAKFRLGGALLTLTGMMTLAGCGDAAPTVMCYDPTPKDAVEIEREGAYEAAQSVKNGDNVNIKVRYFSAHGIKISIETALEDAEVLQSRIYEIKDSSTEISHIIDVADYVGEAYLKVFVMLSEDYGYVRDYLKLNVLE